MPPDYEHWHINARVHTDRVEEIHYISDPERNIRKQQCVKTWHVEKVLGKGGFGVVRLERNREEGKTRAVKRITTTRTELTKSECERELQALLEFSKPKSKEAAVFVDFYGWFRDGSDVFLAMEYVRLGDLEQNIVGLGKIPETEARDIAEQILSGLDIMHAQSFAHRDLKPQNVLVVHPSPSWWVKIADFGLSKRLTDATAVNTRGGSLPYMAPEVLNYLPGGGITNTDYPNSVDIWATGCIIYRIICGVIPFPPGTSLMKYCEDKSLFPLAPMFDSGIRSECFNFLSNVLVTKPQDRPSAAEALQHRWITPELSVPMPRSSIVELAAIQISDVSKNISSEGGWNTITHAGLKSVLNPSAYKPPGKYLALAASYIDQASKETALLEKSIPQLIVNLVKTVEAPAGQVYSLADTTKQSVTQAAAFEALNQNVVIPKPTTFVPKPTTFVPKPTTFIPKPTTSPPHEPCAVAAYARRSVVPGPSLPNRHIVRLPSLSIEKARIMSVTHVRAICTYYNGKPEDLWFQEGELIEVLDSLLTTCWWIGSTRNHKGFFPIDCVEHDLVKGHHQLRQATMSRVRAIKNFTASEPDEISLDCGHVCNLLKIQDNGMLKGVLISPGDEREGYFPASVVEDLPMPTPKDFFSGKVSLVAAMFDFKGGLSDDLSFEAGSVIAILRAETMQRWYGRIVGPDRPVRSGWFPVCYTTALR